MKGNENNGSGTPKGARIAFGILMICVYIGVGLLFIFQVFNTINPTVNYVIGGLLCLYGIWRGVRLYKGWG